MSHEIAESESDLLQGGAKIGRALQELGWGNGTPDDAYYAFRTKTWPISKLGKSLIASHAGLVRHSKKITAAE
jgi:hypothetical protein